MHGSLQVGGSNQGSQVACGEGELQSQGRCHPQEAGELLSLGGSR